MVDTKLLDELRLIVEQNGEAQITQKTLNKLTLAAVTETLSKVGDLDAKLERMLDELRYSETQWHEKRDKHAGEQDKLLENVKETTDAVKEKVGSIDARLLIVEQNVIIKAGKFISAHPKESLIIFAVAVALVSLWDLRGFIAGALGIPLGALTPTPTVTP